MIFFNVLGEGGNSSRSPFDPNNPSLNGSSSSFHNNMHHNEDSLANGDEPMDDSDAEFSDNIDASSDISGENSYSQNMNSSHGNSNLQHTVPS